VELALLFFSPLRGDGKKTSDQLFFNSKKQVPISGLVPSESRLWLSHVSGLMLTMANCD